MAIKVAGITVIDDSRNITNVTGVVNYISAGSGVSINQSTGNVTITATANPLVNGATLFTSPGTFTIGTNTPTSVTTIKITGSGGGGNSAGGGNSSTGSMGGGGGGGKYSAISPTVLAGAGGAGGAGYVLIICS